LILKSFFHFTLKTQIWVAYLRQQRHPTNFLN
jgi:hypothetical protein